MDTLNLEANGWRMQREYPIRPRFIVAEDERELGNVKSVAVAQRALRRFTLRYKTDLRSAAEYVESFFGRQVGPVARFQMTLPEYAPTPDAAPVVEAVAGGTQGSRTIYVRFAWRNVNGTTLASATASILIPANNLLRVKFPYYPPSITQAVVYATQGAQGTEVEQTVVTNQPSWTQPNAALLLLTAAPETANTAKVLAKLRLLETYELIRQIGTQYQLSLDLEEVH